MNYDVIIVGAGPAGVSAAYDLNEFGYKVLIIDRYEEIKQKACAGGLTEKSINKIRYNLDEVIRLKSNKACFSLTNSKNSKFDVESSEVGVTLTVRHELDQYCLEQTLKQGVDFKCEPNLIKLEESGNIINLFNHKGDKYSAQFIIGADGAKSRIRSLLNIQRKISGFAIEGLASLEEFNQCQSLMFDFSQLKNGYGWLFPKGDHVNIGLYSSTLKDVELSKFVLSSYALERFGASKLKHIVGAPLPIDGTNYQPQHSRVFLIGDAAGFAEGFLGEGIHNAIHSGQIVAAAINQSLSLNTDALLEYKKQLSSLKRNQILMNQSAKAFHKLLPLSYYSVKAIAPGLKRMKDSFS